MCNGRDADDGDRDYGGGGGDESDRGDESERGDKRDGRKL